MNDTKKTDAREFALQYLFQDDSNILEDLSNLAEFEESATIELNTAQRDYAKNLIFGVLKDKDSLIKELESIIKGWKVERISKVDMGLMLISAYEMKELKVPAAISINEAVELAKKYSTQDSGSFINGVLDKINQGQ